MYIDFFRLSSTVCLFNDLREKRVLPARIHMDLYRIHI